MEQALDLSKHSESSIEEPNNTSINEGKSDSVDQILTELGDPEERVELSPRTSKKAIPKGSEKLRVYAKLQTATPIRVTSQGSHMNINILKEAMASNPTNIQQTLPNENQTSIILEDGYTPQPLFTGLRSKLSPSASSKILLPGVSDSPTMSSSHLRRSSLIPSFSLKGEKEVPIKAHVRRLSNPNVLNLVAMSPKIGQIKVVNPEASPIREATRKISIIPNSDGAYMNVNVQPIISVQAKPKSLINSPDLTKTPGSPFTPSQMNGSKFAGPISSDYLARVLANKNKDNSASTIDSHRSVESLSPPLKNNKDTFVKRGSFSVFRQIVESEIKK